MEAPSNRFSMAAGLPFFIAAVGVTATATMGSAKADALATPAMEGPLKANANPIKLDAGPLGDIYITGALSGIAMAQDNAVPGDHDSLVDVSNARVFIQKTDGLIQFFVQGGAYSLPALGTAYVRAGDATTTFMASCRKGF